MPRRRPISSARLLRDPVARRQRIAELAVELRAPGLGRNEIAARVEERRAITELTRAHEIAEQVRQIDEHQRLVARDQEERARMAISPGRRASDEPILPYCPSRWDDATMASLRRAANEGRLVVLERPVSETWPTEQRDHTPPPAAPEPTAWRDDDEDDDD